jgi:hypothetical protein
MSIIAYSKVKKINGWLGFTDFEIFKCLICYQNTFSDSALVEIGVHRGKSLALIASLSGSSMLYAIDVFDDQSANIDFSGSGNRAQFLKNVKEFGIDESRIVIDPRISNDVIAQDILGRVGAVRFFHIDGGHHHDAVFSDLQLAAAVAVKETVIAVDDVFRPEWPDVSIATFGTDLLLKNGFTIFAVGFNKTYFCREEMVSTYQEQLKKEARLRPFLRRNYEVRGRSILIFQTYPMAEWRFAERLKWYFSIWHPEIYLVAWKIAKKINLK